MPDKPVYITDPGDALQVSRGGEAKIDSGGLLRINHKPCNIARGEVTLDGSNPTSVVTGLTTIAAAFACIKSAAALGDDPVAVSVDYGGSVPAGQLDLYAWKQNGSDPTLVASTDNAAVISWIAIGS